MRGVRALVVTPAIVLQALLFLTPLTIVLSYSFLTRGVYGGVAGPLTLESYGRMIDPLYAVILWRSLLMAGGGTLLRPPIPFPVAGYNSPSGRRKELAPFTLPAPFRTHFLVAHPRR